MKYPTWPVLKGGVHPLPSVGSETDNFKFPSEPPPFQFLSCHLGETPVGASSPPALARLPFPQRSLEPSAGNAV